MAEKNLYYSRQDSGFGSGAPTPVTPSQQDLQAPQPLPPIAERMNGGTREHTVERLSRLSIDNGHQRLQESLAGLSRGRPRPTSLSPNPLSQGHESHTTPISPSTAIFGHIDNKDYRNVLPGIQNDIKERADRIVSNLVPETTLPLSKKEVLTTTAATNISREGEGLPCQDIRFPLNQEYLQLGYDGYYHEHRDYFKSNLLGEGGFAKVYVCCDNAKLTMFAMKCNRQNNEAKLKTMLEECQVMHNIGDHDNITRFMGALIDDSGDECGKIGRMMMEMAPNGDLSQLLVDQETGESGLPLDQSLYYLQQILFAVHYLHTHNTLHLDLKCQNVLVFNDGRTVKVTDFGTAVQIDSFAEMKGYTPNFSAPEVVRNECPSFSADIWSVMCVLVEMLTGKLPWCYQYDMMHQQVIMMVGSYHDDKFPLLVPFEDLQLEDDIVDLMKLVLQNNSSQRPTALHLLQHSVIKDAYEYQKYFEPYDMEDDMGVPPPLEEYTPPMGVDMIDAKHLSQTAHTMPTGDFMSCPSPVHVKIRPSVDSGTGSSIPDRSSTGSNSVITGTPDSINDRIPHGDITASSHISRHKSVPLLPHTLPSHWQSITAGDLASRYKELPISSSLAQYCYSAPSRLNYLEEPKPFEGGEAESDGTSGKGVLKRTTSAQYVLNGPETDRNMYRGELSLLAQSPTRPLGTVSVGTQTTSSPTIESQCSFPPPLLPNVATPISCSTHQRSIV